MNYKEKYEHGLECIQEILSGAGDSIKTSILRKRLQAFFPELRESEDERIRKGIIRNLEYLADKAEGFVKDELKERIAWLERQGEKKPTGNAKVLLQNYLSNVTRFVNQFKKDFGL